MQIANVQQLMRMELRLPSADAWRRFGHWYLEGLRALLPASISHWGWRPQSRLIELNRLGDVDQRSIIEQSRFGARRRVSDQNANGLPIQVALPNASIYRTQISLPSEAAGTVAKTVALRLDELSPIPPEDACFAIGETLKTADGRLQTEIALTKKKTLAAIRTQFADDDLAAIGAAPDQGGAFRFTFQSGAMQQQPMPHRWINPAIIAAAAIIFFLSIDMHLSQRQQALELYEAELLAALKDLRPARALFDGADDTVLTGARGNASTQMIALVQTSLGQLPPDSRIESLTLNNVGGAISGWTPVKAPDAADLSPLQRMPSQRPGFDRFSFDLNAQAAP